MAQPYQITTETLLDNFNSSLAGLNETSVIALRQQLGSNTITAVKKGGKWRLLLAQFTDVMIVVLLVAAVISFFVGETTDAFVIVAIIIGNAWMGFFQANKAENAIGLLQKMVPAFAMVVREGKPIKMPAEQLVPGDILLLTAGDVVPADARLIKMEAFKTAEASLTGESAAVAKQIEVISDDALVPGDQLNMVFKGTQVINGTASAMVTAIGMQTELGKIADLLQIPAAPTPLQQKLNRFSKQLAVVVVLICAVIFIAGLIRGVPVLQMFLTAMSLAVAALPEALPAVITIALARGASNLVRQKALMRNLPAVETLGAVTYICSDKTGTLTQNRMTVEKAEAIPEQEALLWLAMLVNNEVRFSETGLLGDSTETAMVQYAIDKGQTKAAADTSFPTKAALPFDANRMRMSTLHLHQGRWLLLVKGAPGKIGEVLAEKEKAALTNLLQQNKAWATTGLRVLFFAYQWLDADPGTLTVSMETDLNYLGMVGMIDPPRPEVIAAIAACKTAGIKTVMITGDQALTAGAIAERLGILPHPSGAVKQGADLNDLSGADLQAVVLATSVYARVSPAQKLQIVGALQASGAFVAMTGDGMNDAPALKQANIGIAMGITGTDVSKEAADMILLDDNFTTIVAAVKEGRKIFDNIQKFMLYVLSCNLGELLTILVAPMLGWSIPLLPIHILWINLVTDGLPGLALVTESAEENIMLTPPRDPKESLFTAGLLVKTLLSGVLIAAATLLVQWWGIKEGYNTSQIETMVFTTLCFVQLGNALSVRSANFPILSKQLFDNRLMWWAIVSTVALQMILLYWPIASGVFKTSYLNSRAMIAILVATVGALVGIELFKMISKRRISAPKANP